MSLSKLLEKENITGDLAKLISGEAISLPAEFKDQSEYENHLWSQYEQQRDAQAAERYKHLIDEKVKKKAEELYPATVNPIKNYAATLFNLDKEALSDMKPKEVLDHLHEKLTANGGVLHEDRSAEIEELMQTLQKSKKSLTRKSKEIDKLKARLQSEVETARNKGQEESREFIRQSKLMALASDLKPELTCGSTEQALDSITGACRRHGYSMDVHFNADKNAHELVIVNKDGSKDHNKDKKKSPKELVLELAAKENFLRRSNTGEPNPDTLTVFGGGAEKVNTFIPDFLKG